jgi:transposase
MEKYLTVRQLAEVLGVPIETIRVRLHRASKQGCPLPKSRFRVMNGRKVKEYEVDEFLKFMNLFFRPPRNTSFYKIWRSRTIKLDSLPKDENVRQEGR